jgi:hypothetical protein
MAKPLGCLEFHRSWNFGWPFFHKGSMPSPDSV